MCAGEEQEREGKEGPRHRAEATLPLPPGHISCGYEKGALRGRKCALRRRVCSPGLRRLVEVREVAAEEVARALLHLPDALAGKAPLLAEVLQRAGIVLSQAVAENVPGQLAHALADAAERVAHVFVLLGAQELGIRTRSLVSETVEVRRIAVAVGAQRLLQRNVAWRQPAVRHRPAHLGRANLRPHLTVRANPPT